MATDASTQLIERQDQLRSVAEVLRHQPRVAVDTEADSFYHYHEKVCLLQLSIPGQTWLLDVLRMETLEPLRPVFANPSVEKVLHGADYDVRILARDYGIVFEQLFDTMVAAQLLGLPSYGLAALLKHYLGIELDKKLQRADWSRRPLPDEMARYAAEDTAYLLDLRDLLCGELEKNHRLEWLREECQQLVAGRATTRTPPRWYAIKSTGRLQPQQQAVLQALLDEREAQAKARDLPPFKVIQNELLLDLAVSQPATTFEMRKSRGFPHRAGSMLIDGLLTAIHHGQQLTPGQWPAKPRHSRALLSATQKTALQQLKAVRDRTAVHLAISPGLLCSNGTLEQLVTQPPATEEALLSQLTRWRGSVVGKEFFKILSPSTHAAGL